MGCSSCQQNNHITPVVVNNTSAQTFCDCACGCSEPVCPTPQPCTEITDSQCVIYTGNVLTNGISVQAALEELAVKAPTPVPAAAAMLIPNLKVGALQGNVHVSLDFYDNSDWLNHNPRIFLFRTKKRKNPKWTGFKGRPSQWVHPTHLGAGNGSKWFQGSMGYNAPDGGNPILRHTEFQLAQVNPYVRFNLADQGMSPYEWITYTRKNSRCQRIQLSCNGNFGNFSTVLSALGTINGHPYYEFSVSGQVFRVFYETASGINLWIVQWTGDSTGAFSCSLFDKQDLACPYSGNNWQVNNASDSGVHFDFFMIDLVETVTKRQALLSDLPEYSVNNIGENSLIEKGYCFSINTPKSYFGDLAWTRQKIKFKLAIVIDNPNATSDKPYLIGPMSDSFVLRFVHGSYENEYAKFTNDFVRTTTT